MEFTAYDIGCRPSPSVPAETLIQDGWNAYLLFYAVSQEIQQSGCLEDLGVAILRCEAVTTRFGYPNDEGMPEHSLCGAGLERVDSPVVRVVGSPWTREVVQQMEASRARIWARREMTPPPMGERELFHFVIPLKEATFECVATRLTVDRYAETFREAFDHVLTEVADH